ncbi:hypothetical protein GCM10009623_36910 [Nocardioides aestuarii]|uniref:Regulatory protein RecX n=1 Tax=Nocardioides aestuarii TaxID=252231 RepID=A0ABW4TR49_9ACTN
MGAGRSSKRSPEPARARPRVETESWRGDVGLGVEAWGAAAPPDDPPVDPEVAGPDADPESVARTILLDQLTGRARSRKELADKLASKNVPGEIASRLLDRFEEVGLVDDAAFARSWVEGRHTSRGLAPRAIAQELRRKGVDDEVAREALDELGSEEQLETARRLVRKKRRSLERFDEQTRTRRLVGLLARKGYPAGLAWQVVREELGESDDSPDAPFGDL